MTTNERLMLAQRSLVGLAVGDAFGETMFGQPQEVARRVAKRLISTKRPWRWTDDTAMALSIVEILGRHGAIDTDALAEAFARRWADEPSRGYGQGAFNLLTRVSRGAPWRREAQRLFNGQGSFGLEPRCEPRRLEATSRRTSNACVMKRCVLRSRRTPIPMVLRVPWPSRSPRPLRRLASTEKFF